MLKTGRQCAAKGLPDRSVGAHEELRKRIKKLKGQESVLLSKLRELAN